jgi:hypothetical protein
VCSLAQVFWLATLRSFPTILLKTLNKSKK